jgi:hypothetical protein
MRFAAWVFRIAGLYGLLVTLPLFVQESQYAVPLPVNHPEFYYGFAGVVLAWQVAFFVIGSNPIRYRTFMLVAVLEKASALAFVALWMQKRAPDMWLAAGLIDLTLGVLFGVAWFRTRNAR